MNSQVDPGSIVIAIVMFIQEQDGTFVPAFVPLSDVGDLDGRLTYDAYSSVKRCIHAWRVVVEEDEDRCFKALLAPGDDVLYVGALRVLDLALEDPARANDRRFVDGVARRTELMVELVCINEKRSTETVAT